MITVPVVLTDGTSYDMSVEMLSREEVFQTVQRGILTFEQFENWCNNLAAQQFNDGYTVGTSQGW